MNKELFKFSPQIKTTLSVFIFIGVLTFLIGILFFDAKRVWSAFLVSSLFVLFLSLGGVFFTAIQHVSKAGWSVNIRRFMESFAAYIPYGCFFAFFLFLFGDSIYMWLDPDTVKNDALLMHKSGYLNPYFLFLRLALFSGIWLALSSALNRNSLCKIRLAESL